MALWFWSLDSSIPNYLDVIPSPSRAQPLPLATCLSAKTCSREEVNRKAFMVGVRKLYWMSNTCWVVSSGSFGHAYVPDTKEIIYLAPFPQSLIQSQNEIHKGKLEVLLGCTLSRARLGWNIQSRPVPCFLPFLLSSANAWPSFLIKMYFLAGRSGTQILTNFKQINKWVCRQTPVWTRLWVVIMRLDSRVGNTKLTLFKVPGRQLTNYIQKFF